MELFAVSGLVNALTAVSFGILVFIKNWRARQNQIFLLMTATLAVWGFAYWRWLSSYDAETALLWVRILAVGSVFIPVFFFDWVTILLQKGRKLRDFVTLAYLASITVSAFVFSDYFIAGIEPKLWFPFWPNAGVLYATYFWILYTGVVLWSVHALYHGWRDEREPHRRGQIFYVFWGAVLGFGGGFTNFFLWFDIPIPPYGNFLVAAFPFLLGFSVIRYGLFNAKTIATEILVFFTALILFIQFVLSNSTVEYILRGIFFAAVTALGYLLIRSVYKEVKQREQIEKLSEEKSEFMSFATHQVKRPLSAFKSASSMLLQGDYGPLSSEVRKVVQDLYQAANEAVPMVQAFLDSSKLEQEGGMTYQMEKSDLREIAAQVANEEKFAAEEKGLTLSFEAGGDTSFIVHGDALKLKQVFYNLVDNAVKYTEKGGIAITLKKSEGKITFSVRDTGRGIPKEEIPKLFKKFSRTDGAEKINIASNGLGLYLAAEFVKAHHGKIWAESEGTNKGATFFVELPVS